MADLREALRKLQSGQALTPQEKANLNIGPATVSTVDNTPTISGKYYGPATSPDVVAAQAKENIDVRTKEYGQFQAENEPKWQMLGGILHYGGQPFTGDKGYERYKNGILTEVAVKDENGNLVWKPAESAKKTTDTQTATTNLLAQQQASAQAAADKAARQSAYDILYQQFSQYGLGSLVEGIKGLIQENVSPSEFAIRLQNTDAYKQRFAANQERIKQGLRALTPAEYIGLEDQYQNIMRNYGLPSSYWSKDSMGTQAGFNKFIANDVSASELEDRIATAQKRVLNADVNVMDALKQFYPDITKGDLLAYTLDPTNALENIKRKVTAAEIGGAAMAQGLATGVSRAEELAKYGITKAQAQQGYGQIGEFLPAATKLGDIYAQQGLGPYDQLTAEAEVFGTAGAAQAAQKRKKLAELETRAFQGQGGTAQGALARDRAGAY